MTSTGFVNSNMAKMPMPMPDPTKEPNPIAGLAPAITAAELYVPPSPRTNRLRKLQSAHNLGAAARNAAANGINNGGGGGVAQQPSLITQQRLKDLQERTTSPTRRHPPSSNRSPQRHRSNSDAPTPPPNLIPSSTFNPAVPLRTKRSALSRSSPAADTMSLERLIRDGPPNGDVRGALESARLKVLDQGIKADSDGMVSFYCPLYLLSYSHRGTINQSVTYILTIVIRFYHCSLPAGSTSGSSYSTRPSSKPTPT